MNLNNHFHPPLSVRRHWHSFFHAWATFLAADLNTRLPKGYFAEPNVQFGIDIDVAAFEEAGVAATVTLESAPVWNPPPPTLTIPMPVVTDVVEVLLYDSTAGPVLAGAIELVSPANKDREEHREAFVSKCETYLTQGVGLVVADVVTERTANLHALLLARFNGGSDQTPQYKLYAAAYRPALGNEQSNLAVWYEPLEVGKPLPIMPLWVRGLGGLPVMLGQTYERTCQELRLDDVVS